MKYTVGSNQFKKTTKSFTTKKKFISTGFLIIFLMGALNSFFPTKTQAILSPVAANASYLNSAHPVASLSAQVVPLVKADKSLEQMEIENYIRTIFKGDADMAIRVTHHECSPQHKMYPNCEKKDNIEWSCGIWQINLRDPKTMKLIHAAKVKGATLEEKCENLKDPYMSTLIAYYIYTHQNFCPWTWYKNNYCK